MYTWRKGKLVGSDDKGNLFYECDDSSRRWVIFKNNVDASVISSGWHGWLHHTVSVVPNEESEVKNIWEKPHVENKTGSKFAYHPLGENRLKTVNYKDYEAWSPENE